METIFTSADLYNYILEKLNTGISNTQKLSLLFKSVQKDFPVDDYMVVIFINYMRLLTDLKSDDIPLIYKTSKMKYFKYLIFWKEYTNYMISHKLNVDKVVADGIKFIDVKEFENKECILSYLERVRDSDNKNEFVYEWNSEWLCTKDIGKDTNIVNSIHDYSLPKKSYKKTDSSYKTIDSSYKKTDSSYKTLQTPSTDSVNKYSYKADIIKCKLEDVSMREDSGIWNYKPITDKKQEYFTINNKQLLKIKIIGKGGSSKVYKVLYENEFYALKIINVELETNLKELLVEEIKLLERLKDNNGIIKMIDHEILQDNIYILMEYGEADLMTFIKDSRQGINKRQEEKENIINKNIKIEVEEDTDLSFLNQYSTNKNKNKEKNNIQKKERRKKEEVKYEYIEIGDTLLYKLHHNRVRYIWQEMLLIVQNIHEARIIHGDLKPANFVFVKNRLKIIDFGISKPLNGNTTRVDMDIVCGTLNYCAPELFYDKKKRRSSDVWSLGIILYEMWYGRTPLDSYKTYVEKRDNILYIQNKLVIKSSVDKVIYKCLEGDCRKRPTVDELLHDTFTYDD